VETESLEQQMVGVESFVVEQQELRMVASLVEESREVVSGYIETDSSYNHFASLRSYLSASCIFRQDHRFGPCKNNRLEIQGRSAAAGRTVNYIDAASRIDHTGGVDSTTVASQDYLQGESVVVVPVEQMGDSSTRSIYYLTGYLRNQMLC
jgi:hypothetical protein